MKTDAISPSLEFHVHVKRVHVTTNSAVNHIKSIKVTLLVITHAIYYLYNN